MLYWLKNSPLTWLTTRGKIIIINGLEQSQDDTVFLNISPLRAISSNSITSSCTREIWIILLTANGNVTVCHCACCIQTMSSCLVPQAEIFGGVLSVTEHSFTLSNHFILVRLMVDLEYWWTRWEYTLDWMSVHLRAPDTHTFTHIGQIVFGKKPTRTQGEHGKQVRSKDSSRETFDMDYTCTTINW